MRIVIGDEYIYRIEGGGSGGEKGVYMFVCEYIYTDTYIHTHRG